MLCAKTINLFKVRDIDWTDFNINRAGVTPIYDDGIHKWIGFGITNFATNITPIGGLYESNDHDLLSTAVREYNEEVDCNLPHITDESVYNLYAIKTNYMIEILLPISFKPDKFVKTEELYDMIWVTPEQLLSMAKNKNYILPSLTSRSKAYSFSGGLFNAIPDIITAVTSGIPFKETWCENRKFFSRSKRKDIRHIPKIITSLDEFINNTLVPRNFVGQISVVLKSDVIGIMRHDRTIYLLSVIYLPNIVKILDKLQTRIYVSTDIDRNYVRKLLPCCLKTLKSIEYVLENANEMKCEFFQDIEIVRRENNIVSELKLILDYERKNYEIIQNKSDFFNEKRAYFLRVVSNINKLLSQGPMELMQLRKSISGTSRDLGGRCLRVKDIINILIETQLVSQDTKANLISIIK